MGERIKELPSPLPIVQRKLRKKPSFKIPDGGYFRLSERHAVTPNEQKPFSFELLNALASGSQQQQGAQPVASQV